MSMFFLILVIVIKHPTGLCSNKKGISVFFWIFLLHEVSRLSPYTHTHQHTRTSRIFCIFAVHWRIYPFIGGESDVPWKERKSQFWIVSSRLRPYSDFPKHSRKSRTVQCKPNPGKSLHTHGSQICIYNKKK